jgi:MFS family permease
VEVIGRQEGKDVALGRALRTGRFWWIAAGYFWALFSGYAIQVHQTNYLIEIGFGAGEAAWALGWVALAGVPGQLALGHLSDRIGREWAWSLGSLGFVLCALFLLLLKDTPSPALLYLMVLAQGALGYGLAPVFGAIPAEIFQGRQYGTIFGSLMLAAIAGGAAGPWLAGVIHDATGSYDQAFWISLCGSAFSAVAIWIAAPRRVRAVAGQIGRIGSMR